MQGGNLHGSHFLCYVTAEPGDCDATMVTAGTGHRPDILQGVRIWVEPVNRVTCLTALTLTPCVTS